MPGKKNPARNYSVACRVCGGVFMAQKRSDCYCSSACRTAGAYAVKLRTKVPAVCGVCGKSYMAWKHRVGVWHFCSKPCAYAGRRNEKPKGADSPSWRGGFIVDAQGYRRKYIGDGKYVHEHRLVMAEKLGRVLLSGERVHHINGNRQDNRPENLELWTHTHPSGVRAKDVPHCPTCRCSV